MCEKKCLLVYIYIYNWIRIHYTSAHTYYYLLLYTIYVRPEADVIPQETLLVPMNKRYHTTCHPLAFILSLLRGMSVRYNKRCKYILSTIYIYIHRDGFTEINVTRPVDKLER